MSWKTKKVGQTKPHPGLHPGTAKKDINFGVWWNLNKICWLDNKLCYYWLHYFDNCTVVI